MLLLSLAATSVLAVLHVLAGRLRFLDVVPRSRWLSIAGGSSVAYVFVHLLPELAAAQVAVHEAGMVRWLDQHVYLLALGGLALFYAVERHSVRTRVARRRAGLAEPEGSTTAWLSFASYTVYNALIGYLLTERGDVQALVLFAVALGLHFVVNDYGLRQHHGVAYQRYGRWVCAAGIVAGWVVGVTAEVAESHLALVLAFLAGGVVLNVLKEELPEDRESSLGAFLLGAGGYAALLLLL